MNNPFEIIEVRLTNIEHLLVDIMQHNNSLFSEGNVERIMTIKEAANFLSLSVPTIYGLVQRAEIPVSKKGKRLYFSYAELTSWIKAGRKKTIHEFADEASTNLVAKKGTA